MSKIDLHKMLELAKSARMSAYAPYSKFLVGCCIYSKEKGYHVGCNVENAAYPMGQCAEATAIGNMILSGAKTITAVLVLTDLEAGGSACGGCLQKLSEFTDAETILYSANLHGMTRVQKFSELFAAEFTCTFNRSLGK